MRRLRHGLARTALAVVISVPNVQAAERAGVAAAVRGEVTVSGEPRPEPVDATSGMDMLRFDRVVTDAESRMQILLLDQTNFSVGPNSELIIDEFVYDPENGTGEVAAEFVEGVFRYVSGSVGQNDPDNVEVETAAGTIGVRGTALFARKAPDGEDVFVGLLGPGNANNAGLNRGGFTFSNAQGSTTVLRSGFGVRATPGQAPSAPVQIPQELIASLQQSLQGRPNAARAARPATGDAGGGATGEQAASARIADPADASGQSTARGRELGQAVLARASTEDQLSQAQSDATETINTRAVTDQMNEMRNASRLMPSADALLAQLSWGDANDLDLHVTGPRVSGDGRFHTYFGNPGSLEEAPFTALDEDFVGQNGNEVAAIEELNSGGPTRISAFNFGDQVSDSTSLANQSDAMMTLLRGGAIERGPGGSVVVNGEQLNQITPPADQAGNTWVGFEVDPESGQINVINEITNSAGSASVD
jgi:hypothetical protein